MKSSFRTATRASSVIRTAELDKRKREARFIASMEKGMKMRVIVVFMAITVILIRRI